MAEKFLAKYFPPAKTTKMWNDISSFSWSETLYNMWERIKELLRKYSHHGLPLWLQVQTFYNMINSATRQMIDAVAKRTLNSKTLEVVHDLNEQMAKNSYQCVTGHLLSHKLSNCVASNVPHVTSIYSSVNTSQSQL